MIDLPRQFVITGPGWAHQTHYIVDLDDVDNLGRVKITYAPGHADGGYPADYVFRQSSEETVRGYLERGSWIIVEDLTLSLTCVEDLI